MQFSFVQLLDIIIFLPACFHVNPVILNELHPYHKRRFNGPFCIYGLYLAINPSIEGNQGVYDLAYSHSWKHPALRSASSKNIELVDDSGFVFGGSPKRQAPKKENKEKAAHHATLPREKKTHASAAAAPKVAKRTLFGEAAGVILKNVKASRNGGGGGDGGKKPPQPPLLKSGTVAEIKVSKAWNGERKFLRKKPAEADAEAGSEASGSEAERQKRLKELVRKRIMEEARKRSASGEADVKEAKEVEQKEGEEQSSSSKHKKLKELMRKRIMEEARKRSNAEAEEKGKEAATKAEEVPKEEKRHNRLKEMMRKRIMEEAKSRSAKKEEKEEQRGPGPIIVTTSSEPERPPDLPPQKAQPPKKPERHLLKLELEQVTRPEAEEKKEKTSEEKEEASKRNPPPFYRPGGSKSLPRKKGIYGRVPAPYGGQAVSVLNAEADNKKDSEGESEVKLEATKREALNDMLIKTMIRGNHNALGSSEDILEEEGERRGARSTPSSPPPPARPLDLLAPQRHGTDTLAHLRRESQEHLIMQQLLEDLGRADGRTLI